MIICPTLRKNDTYHAKEWVKNDDKVWLVDPRDNLYQWIKKLSELLRFLEVLFIIDDIIANEGLDKRRQPLLELSISGRHRGHYFWLLTQSYPAIPKNLRRQAKTIFVWYPKERGDLKRIHDEKDVLADDELFVARNFLKKSKHVCLYIRKEFRRGFCVKQKMTEEEKKNNNTRKTLWTVAQGHQLAALMKKKKEEILRNKE